MGHSMAWELYDPNMPSREEQLAAIKRNKKRLFIGFTLFLIIMIVWGETTATGCGLWC